MGTRHPAKSLLASMVLRDAPSGSTTATTAPPEVWGARRGRRARYLRVAYGVAVFLLIDVAAYFAGQALHSHGAAHPVNCPLVTTGSASTRAVVTYLDDTHSSRMRQAIRAAVAAWNGAPTDVALEPGRTAALTFRAGHESQPVPPCRSATARSVVVTLDTAQWGAARGPSAVGNPEASMAKVIGHALGLPVTGTCPALMAAKDCTRRNAAPGRSEVATVNRLYRRPG